MIAQQPPSLLILAMGNPSRGDDALGPCFIERVRVSLQPLVSSGAVELLTDFQLQVEHALDIAGRRWVVFVDASVLVPPPFSYLPVEPKRDPSFTTHAMSPAAVLEVHRQVIGTPPPAWILAIRGRSFELGEALTGSADANLEAAVAFFVGEWRAFLQEGVARGAECRGSV